jgi:hypothetical protein
MSTVVGTAVRSILGLALVSAMLALAWLADGSSVSSIATAMTPGVGVDPARIERAPAQGSSVLAGLHSARADRAAVVRTSIPVEQLEQLQNLSSRSMPLVTVAPAPKGRGKKDLL